MKDLLLYDRPDWMHYISTDGSIVIMYRGVYLYAIDVEAVEEAGMQGKPGDAVREWICYEWKDDVLDAIEESDRDYREALEAPPEESTEPDDSPYI